MRMKKGLYLSVAVIATTAFLAGSPVRVYAQQGAQVSIGTTDLGGVVRQQGLQGASGQMRQDDLRGGAAVERHQPSALVAHWLLRAAAHDLVRAHDAVMKQTAQDGSRAFDRMQNEIDHDSAGRDQHRIGGLNLPLHLDDGGPERVAGARDRRDQAGAGELLEIAIGGLGRDAEHLGGLFNGPLRALDCEQSQRHQQTVATAPRYALDRHAHAFLATSLGRRETVQRASQKMTAASS